MALDTHDVKRRAHQQPRGAAPPVCHNRPKTHRSTAATTRTTVTTRTTTIPSSSPRSTLKLKPAATARPLLLAVSPPSSDASSDQSQSSSSSASSTTSSTGGDHASSSSSAAAPLVSSLMPLLTPLETSSPRREPVGAKMRSLPHLNEASSEPSGAAALATSSFSENDNNSNNNSSSTGGQCFPSSVDCLPARREGARSLDQSRAAAALQGGPSPSSLLDSLPTSALPAAHRVGTKLKHFVPSIGWVVSTVVDVEWDEYGDPRYGVRQLLCDDDDSDDRNDPGGTTTAPVVRLGEADADAAAALAAVESGCRLSLFRERHGCYGTACVAAWRNDDPQGVLVRWETSEMEEWLDLRCHRYHLLPNPPPPSPAPPSPSPLPAPTSRAPVARSTDFVGNAETVAVASSVDAEEECAGVLQEGPDATVPSSPDGSENDTAGSSVGVAAPAAALSEPAESPLPTPSALALRGRQRQEGVGSRRHRCPTPPTSSEKQAAGSLGASERTTRRNNSSHRNAKEVPAVSISSRIPGKAVEPVSAPKGRSRGPKRKDAEIEGVTERDFHSSAMASNGHVVIPKPNHSADESNDRGDPEDVIVGSRVGVWWSGDRVYYPGSVVQYDRTAKSRRFRLRYDDGDEEWIDFDRHKFRFLPDSPRRPAPVGKGCHRDCERAELLRCLRPGTRIGVWWDLDRQYYPATVRSVVAVGTSRFRLAYDDGETETLDLRVRDFRLLVDDAAADAPETKSHRPTTRMSAETRRRDSNGSVAEAKDRDVGDAGPLDVGTRVAIWWEGDQKFYQGTVTATRNAKSKYFVKYDDGDSHWLNMAKETYRVVNRPRTRGGISQLTDCSAITEEEGTSATEEDQFSDAASMPLPRVERKRKHPHRSKFSALTHDESDDSDDDLSEPHMRKKQRSLRQRPTRR